MNEASTDLTSIAVALGRIEEKVSHLTGLEDRMRNVESAVTEIKAKQKPSVPWYVVAGGLAGIGAGVLYVLDLLGRLLG